MEYKTQNTGKIYTMCSKILLQTEKNNINNRFLSFPHVGDHLTTSTTKFSHGVPSYQYNTNLHKTAESWGLTMNTDTCTYICFQRGHAEKMSRTIRMLLYL